MELYKISNQYLECARQAEDCEVPEEYIKDTLESITGDFDQKIDNIASLIKNLKAQSMAIKEEIKSLRGRAIQKDRSVDGLLEYLKTNMVLFERHAIETARNKITIKKNPQSVEIQNEEKFVTWAYEEYPDLLDFLTPVPNKKYIKEALKNGENIPYAQLVNKERIEIK
jgi:hypothetical protein